MKNIIKVTFICAILFSVSTAAQIKSGDCNMAVTYSEMAFESFKKAYKTNSPEEMKILLKKAVQEADESSAYALICNCPIAKNYALNAVTFGNKAINTTELENAKKFAKQAMNMSLDVMSVTPTCK
ncbi:hypothetical protein [Chryseobacterium indoltheticum]|uniref:DUF4398 domain-containing protein n=1 Tax=Chryseobacterium indoltheticum TaxID=254 RepID=A0A381FHQ2_9FLAO|nr:hypothetical protein [Chryseobacterium indoltheticum]SUX46070.1 Uncharacterised protein [Chryseobacterium indoltheticum]